MILLPWLSAVALSSFGEYLSGLIMSTGSHLCENFVVAHHSVLVNVGTPAKLSIQVNVILQMLFSL